MDEEGPPNPRKERQEELPDAAASAGPVGPQSHPPAGGRVLTVAEQGELLAKMAELVASSHLFKSLDEEGRKRILQSGYACRFERGDSLMQQGEFGDTMFIVLEGRVRVVTHTAGGTLKLAELGPGACVGEVSVLLGTPRTATVTASGEVDCVAFKRHRIERVLVDYPKVREVLEVLVEGRARDTIEKIVGS